MPLYILERYIYRRDEERHASSDERDMRREKRREKEEIEKRREEERERDIEKRYIEREERHGFDVSAKVKNVPKQRKTKQKYPQKQCSKVPMYKGKTRRVCGNVQTKTQKQTKWQCICKFTRHVQAASPLQNAEKHLPICHKRNTQIPENATSRLNQV